jgi:hypothetical protein
MRCVQDDSGRQAAGHTPTGGACGVRALAIATQYGNDYVAGKVGRVIYSSYEAQCNFGGGRYGATS